MEALAGSENVLILCHQNADPDALGSAYALSRLILNRAPSKGVEVAAPEGISRVGKQILQALPLPVTTSPRLDHVDIIVLVDTNTLVQLGRFGVTVKDSSKPLVLIDHHAPNREMTELASLSITDEEASSTCEIIYGLYEEAHVELDRDVALALFLGIAYDTRHFVIAKSRAFRVVVKLFDAGLVVEDALQLLSLPIEASERIARLKAAQRLRRIRLGEWIVVESRVGSYQSSAARALLALGADVAVVGGERKGRLKFSLRSTKKFFEGTRVHLGRDVAAPLGRLVGGMGGGHSTAAGFNGEGSLDESLKVCLRLLREAVYRSGEAKS